MSQSFNNAMKAVNQRIRRYEFKQRINEHIGDTNKMVDKPIGNTEQPVNFNLWQVMKKKKHMDNSNQKVANHVKDALNDQRPIFLLYKGNEKKELCFTIHGDGKDLLKLFVSLMESDNKFYSLIAGANEYYKLKQVIKKAQNDHI